MRIESSSNRSRRTSWNLGRPTAVDSVDLVERIAAAIIPTTPQAVGASLATAEEVERLLSDARWRVIEQLLSADRDGGDDAALTRLRSALARDEFSEALAPAVEAAYEAGIRLIVPPSAPPPPAPSPSSSSPPPPPGQGYGHATRLTIAEAKAKLAELDASEGAWLIDLTWTAAEG